MKLLLILVVLVNRACAFVGGWFVANHFTHGTSLLLCVPWFLAATLGFFLETRLPLKR